MILDHIFGTLLKRPIPLGEKQFSSPSWLFDLCYDVDAQKYKAVGSK